MSEQPANFAFKAENQPEIEKIFARYPEAKKASAIMPLLHLAQEQEGWVSQKAMEVIAGMVDEAPIRVMEVATFYTMYQLKPVGKHHVRVCTTTPCWLRGCNDVVSAAEDHLGIKLGQTTEDGMFTLGEVECSGACVNAPIVEIDHDYYEDMTGDSMRKVLDAFKAGETPKAGPQGVNRINSAPEGKPTTLAEFVGES